MQIDRLAEIDEAAGGEQLGRRNRNAERQRIGPDQPAVAARPPAAQAGEQAKAAQQADHAIGETDHQPAHHDNVAAVLHLSRSLDFRGCDSRHDLNRMQFPLCYNVLCVSPSTVRSRGERSCRATCGQGYKTVAVKQNTNGFVPAAGPAPAGIVDTMPASQHE